MGTLNWEIIHVPPNPPFIPTQQPTVNVYAAVIDPKIANILVRKLNQIAPLETFRHVKRVRKRSIGGKIELSVILCLAGEDGVELGSMPEDGVELGSMPKDVLELINCYQLSPFVTQAGMQTCCYNQRRVARTVQIVAYFISPTYLQH